MEGDHSPGLPSGTFSRVFGVLELAPRTGELGLLPYGVAGELVAGISVNKNSLALISVSSFGRFTQDE